MHVCASIGDSEVLNALLSASTAEQLALRMPVGSGEHQVFLTPLELAQALMLRQGRSASNQAVVRSLMIATAELGSGYLPCTRLTRPGTTQRHRVAIHPTGRAKPARMMCDYCG